MLNCSNYNHGSSDILITTVGTDDIINSTDITDPSSDLNRNF